MNNVEIAKKIAANAIKYAAERYDLEDLIADPNKKTELDNKMYEFVKYVWGGTGLAALKYILKGKRAEDWFNDELKEEAGWLLIGGTLNDQNQVLIGIPEFLRDTLGGRKSIAVELPHTKARKLIDEDDLLEAIKKYRHQN